MTADKETALQMQTARCIPLVRVDDCVVKERGVRDQDKEDPKHVSTWVKPPRRSNLSAARRSATCVYHGPRNTRMGKVAGALNRGDRSMDPRFMTVEQLQNIGRAPPGWMADPCCSIHSGEEDVINSTMHAMRSLRGASPAGIPPTPGYVSAPYNPNMMIVGCPEMGVMPEVSRGMLVGYKLPGGTKLLFDAVGSGVERDKDGAMKRKMVGVLGEIRDLFLRRKELVDRDYAAREYVFVQKRKALEVDLRQAKEAEGAVMVDEELSEAEAAELICSLRNIQHVIVEKVMELREQELSLLGRQYVRDFIQMMIVRIEVAMRNPRVGYIPACVCTLIEERDPDLASYYYRNRSEFRTEQARVYLKEAAQRYRDKAAENRKAMTAIQAARATLIMSDHRIPVGDRSRRTQSMTTQADSKQRAANEDEAVANSIEELLDSESIVGNAIVNRLPQEVQRSLRKLLGVGAMLRRKDKPRSGTETGAHVGRMVAEGRVMDATEDQMRRAWNEMRLEGRKESKSQYVATGSIPAGVRGRAKKVDTSRMDPPWHPWNIRPLQPMYVKGKQVVTKLPHDYLLEFFLDMCKSRERLDEIVPPWVYDWKCALRERMDLLHGCDFAYTWYPKQLEPQQQKSHRIYIAIVNRLNFLDKLFSSDTIPIGQRRMIALMQDSHFITCQFMNKTGWYSDDEITAAATCGNDAMDADAKVLFEMLRESRQFGIEAMGHDTMEGMRDRQLTYLDLYGPGYDTIVTEGSLPNLTNVIVHIPFFSQRPDDPLSYDEAYLALVRIFRKTDASPMKGRRMNATVSKACAEHRLVREVVMRIFHCSLGGYYEHARTVGNFAVRYALYMRFVTEKMGAAEFSAWLMGAETLDPYLGYEVFRDHSTLVNKVLTEYTGFIITCCKGVHRALNRIFFFDDMDGNVRDGMDMVTDTLNDVCDGDSMGDIRFSARREQFCFRRVKKLDEKRVPMGKGHARDDPRKSGRSASLSRIRSFNGKPLEQVTAEWLVTSAFGDLDSVLYKRDFPCTGESGLVEYEAQRLRNDLCNLGAGDLVGNPVMHVLSAMGLRAARDLQERASSMGVHRCVFKASEGLSLAERRAARNTYHKDERRRYQILHATKMIGREWTDEAGTCRCGESQCARGEESVEGKREAYRAYQDMMTDTRLFYRILRGPTMDVIENGLYWLVHCTNLGIQNRSGGMDVVAFVVEKFQKVYQWYRDVPGLQEKADDITADEMTILSAMADVHKDSSIIPLHWMLERSIGAQVEIVTVMHQAMHLYSSRSYPSDIVKAITQMALNFHREYHLMNYFFVILYQLRSFRIVNLPPDVAYRQRQTLHKKLDLVDEGEPLPPVASMHWLCLVHGLFKMEKAESSQRAVQSLGCINTSADPGTGQKYCKAQYNKTRNGLVRSYKQNELRKKNEMAEAGPNSDEPKQERVEGEEEGEGKEVDKKEDNAGDDGDEGDENDSGNETDEEKETKMAEENMLKGLLGMDGGFQDEGNMDTGVDDDEELLWEDMDPAFLRNNPLKDSDAEDDDDDEDEAPRKVRKRRKRPDSPPNKAVRKQKKRVTFADPIEQAASNAVCGECVVPADPPDFVINAAKQTERAHRKKKGRRTAGEGANIMNMFGMSEDRDNSEERDHRLTMQHMLNKRCNGTPLRPVVMDGVMIYLYDKAVWLCPLCGTACYVTRDKYNEFDICCGVCVQNLRRETPRNVEAYVMFRCMMCSNQKLYQSHEVTRYEVYDNTVPGVRRKEYIYLCGQHNRRNIGKTPCMDKTSIFHYLEGSYRIRELNGRKILYRISRRGSESTLEKDRATKKKKRSIAHTANNAKWPEAWNMDAADVKIN